MPFNNDDNNLLEKNWIVCYKGTANNAIIQDPYLCLFRVQAINNFRHITVKFLFLKNLKLIKYCNLECLE